MAPSSDDTAPNFTALDYTAHVESESARFLHVLSDLDPSTVVPSCPEWSASDLVWHLTEVQHFWAAIVGDRLSGPSDYTRPTRPDSSAEVLSFFETTSGRMLESLQTVADDLAVWTWLESRQDIGFVRRRQAHEALIHRVDAELAANQRSAIDPVLATDGVLEAMEWMFSRAPDWATVNMDGPIGRLSTTDTGASWLVQVAHFSGEDNEGTSRSPKPIVKLLVEGEASFELRGTAADLDCWIWNRPTIEPVAIAGDSSAFAAVVRSGV